MKNLRGLFLNTIKENCSIHESGVMCYNCLKGSDNYHLDYVEISSENRSICVNYDFFVFNYHPWKMNWLNTDQLRMLHGKKYTIVLEVAPNNPFTFVNDQDFDGYIVLDPSITLNHPKVFPFVRPLELDVVIHEQKLSTIPTIGSFGFPTVGKGFELLIDAVNREFDYAIIKINVP